MNLEQLKKNTKLIEFERSHDFNQAVNAAIGEQLVFHESTLQQTEEYQQVMDMVGKTVLCEIPRSQTSIVVSPLQTKATINEIFYQAVPDYDMYLDMMPVFIVEWEHKAMVEAVDKVAAYNRRIYLNQIVEVLE